MAIASLILGVLALLTCGIPMSFGAVGILAGLIAVILGILGRRQLLEEGRSSGMAVGGIVLGVLGLLGGVGNAAVCAACLNAGRVTETEVQSGQDWAQQQQQLLQDMVDQENQGEPAVPATPGVPTTPAVPATPGMPTPATPPTPGGQILSVGMPTGGMFNPGLPTTPDGRPYIDYSFTVAAPGFFTINLVSTTSTYDPYLVLLRDGTELARDDDSGGYPNARINQSLTPGSYTVRVTSFRSSQIDVAAPFTLSVSGG